MTRHQLAALFLGSSLTLACGGDPGETTTTGSSSDTSGTATSGTATTGEPTTGGSTGSTTGGESGSGTQGQTETGLATGTSTGEPATGTSTGEPGSSSGSSGTTTGGGGLCDDWVNPSCMEVGCGEDQECKVLPDVCVPSGCFCDEMTGIVSCTPDCGGGSCVDKCPEVMCDLECEFGFKTDANGCEICECNEPPDRGCGCKLDSDCVKTSSGCCPCNAGGDEVPAHVGCVDDVMQCDLPPDQVNCLQVYKCTDVQPACVQGQCVLQ